jgi:hypothetical protein
MRVALIEFNTYHDEVLPTLVYLLNKLGIIPDVYMPSEAIHKDAFAVAKQLLYRLFSTDGIGRRVRGTPSRLRRYDVVIVNSVEPRDVLRQLAPTSRPTIGVVHNASLLVNDPEYRTLFQSGFRHPLVLSPHIAEFLGQHGQSASWFAHVFFGDNPSVPRDAREPVTFAVSGSLESTRRNFESLLDAVEALDRTGSAFRVRMIGRSNTPDGRTFRSELARRGIDRYFSFTRDEIGHADYFRALAEANFVLPLVDTTSDRFRPYYESKVASSISLAIGFGIPLVAEVELSKLYGVEGAAITYQDGQLADALATAATVPAEEHTRWVAVLSRLRLELLGASVRNLEFALATVLDRHAASIRVQGP